MNPKLNKKVKKFLDEYLRDTKANSPEHQEAVMLILKGALTDANFHSEAKELGKYFPKASKKYIGTPMEDVIESKGTEISKMANWDGHDIIDAFAFYLSMSIGGSFGNRLMSLKESIQVNEKNEPNDKELWSRAIAAAKAKYDVYPSAYANAFASNWYKEKGGTWKTKSESVDENFAVQMMVAKAIAGQKVKNPETKNDVKITTALKDKKHPAHGKAKSLVQRLKDKFSKKESTDDTISEELRPDEVEFIIKKLGNSMPNHTSYDYDKGPTDAQVLKALKKYHSDFFRHSTTKQKKEIVKGIQKYTTESVDEGMVSPRRGHNYYQLTKDTPIKYVSGHSGIGLKVPGVLLHNEYDTIKGKKGAYIIDYFGQHFYVDLKNKFASRIAHPENREQNKDLMKNVKSIDAAPDHSDWKKYVRESVNESVEGMSKQQLDTVARGMFGKSYSRLTMDQRAKLKFYLNQSKKESTVESVNELLAIVDKFDENRQSYGKVYYKDMGRPGDISKAKSELAKLRLNPKRKDLTLISVGRNSKMYDVMGESVNEVKYDTAIADFNKELEKNSEVKKAAKHYKKSTKDVVKALQSKIKVNRYSDKSIKQISIDYKEDGPFSSKVSIKLSKDYKQNESVNEVASRTAMEIGGLTGVNKDAIQKFVDDNKLDIEKVYQFVKKGKLADRMKLVSAIAGKPNNPVQKKMVKQFGEGIIKEAKVRLGKDSVNFKVMGDSKGLTLIAASGNDLDGLQDAIENDVDVKEELRKTLEKQLKVPVEVDRGYDGAGFRFNIDFYSLAKKVK